MASKHIAYRMSQPEDEHNICHLNPIYYCHLKIQTLREDENLDFCYFFFQILYTLLSLNK